MSKVGELTTNVKVTLDMDYVKKYFKEELDKIPEICDEYLRLCNCEWTSEEVWIGDISEKLTFDNFNECPSVCPRYNKKSE